MATSPEQLRRILLLLRGKKKAGQKASKVISRSPNKDFLERQMKASKVFGVEDAADRIDAMTRPPGTLPGTVRGRNEPTENPDPEVETLIQLLAAASEARSKLNARGIQKPLPGDDTLSLRRELSRRLDLRYPEPP